MCSILPPHTTFLDLDLYRDGTYLPSGAVLSASETITAKCADADVGGLDEGSLLVERWKEATGTWEDAACGPHDRHPDEDWLAVPVCHLSRFDLFGKYTVFLPLVLRQ